MGPCWWQVTLPHRGRPPTISRGSRLPPFTKQERKRAASASRTAERAPRIVLFLLAFPAVVAFATVAPSPVPSPVPSPSCVDNNEEAAVRATGFNCATLAAVGHCETDLCPTCPYPGYCDEPCRFCAAPSLSLLPPPTLAPKFLVAPTTPSPTTPPPSSFPTYPPSPSSTPLLTFASHNVTVSTLRALKAAAQSTRFATMNIDVRAGIFFTSEIWISSSVRIESSVNATLRSDGSSRFFFVQDDCQLTISHLALSGGAVDTSYDDTGDCVGPVSLC